MTRRSISISAITFYLALASGTLCAGPRDLVVIRPGGPTASEEANEQVNRLIREIAVRAGWPADSVRAFYFNRSRDALELISSDRPGFVLTTPGFYLAHRVDLGLQPINQILLEGRDHHRYHLVARKDGPASVDALAGKVLAGSALAESPFVERVVLGGRFSLGADLAAEFQRALAALRKLSQGEVDAVILDDKEHAGLDSLPFAGELATIFSSAPIPNTGIFSVAGIARPADTRALLAATENFCGAGDEAAAICETYGISGFREAPPAVFEQLIRRYDGGAPAQ